MSLWKADRENPAFYSDFLFAENQMGCIYLQKEGNFINL